MNKILKDTKKKKYYAKFKKSRGSEMPCLQSIPEFYCLVSVKDGITLEMILYQMK